MKSFTVFLFLVLNISCFALKGYEKDLDNWLDQQFDSLDVNWADLESEFNLFTSINFRVRGTIKEPIQDIEYEWIIDEKTLQEMKVCTDENKHWYSPDNFGTNGNMAIKMK